jgi:predicted nucleic acid-binding protein
MICVDTNYLIRSLLERSREATALIRWYESGTAVFSPAPVWYEFLCGPVTKSQIDIVRAFLSGGIAPFEEAQAAQAAYLFNAIGRVRQFRIDAMIAGTAIAVGASLATSNTRHFKRFEPHGLTLAH